MFDWLTNALIESVGVASPGSMGEIDLWSPRPVALQQPLLREIDLNAMDRRALAATQDPFAVSAKAPKASEAPLDIRPEAQRAAMMLEGQTPEQRLLEMQKSLRGVQAVGPLQVRYPSPPAAPRPSGQIQGSADVLALLKQAQQRQALTSLGAALK